MCIPADLTLKNLRFSRTIYVSIPYNKQRYRPLCSIDRVVFLMEENYIRCGIKTESLCVI